MAVATLGVRIFVAPTGHEGLIVHGGFLVAVGVLLIEILRFMVYLFDPTRPHPGSTVHRVPKASRGK